MNKITAAISLECSKIYSQANDLEQVLSYLRKKGVSKPDSMIALIQWKWLEADEAKLFVHNSKTWADVRSRDENFQDQVIEAIKKDPKVKFDEK